MFCPQSKLSTQEYLDILPQTTWSLSLQGISGAHTDGKNRREPECFSCGMPMALNYKPYYPFPFEANKHYVYLEKPEDIVKLNDIDPQPYADASTELYNQYFSVKGASNLFRKICT